MDIHWRILNKLVKPLLTTVSHRALPQVEGQIKLNGISSIVTIIRDKWGIPRIRAENREDLFFAQGYVHAQDRLWQMEIFRRAASGRLAEILGEQALQTDRLARTLGFARIGRLSWDKTTERIQNDVLAYTEGINAYLNKKPKLSVEFMLLRHIPEKWDCFDSANLSRLMIWPLSHIWSGKLFRAKLIEKIGPELASDLDPFYPDRNPITLPQGIEAHSLVIDKMFKEGRSPFVDETLLGGSQGSNGWVISGKRCATGFPLLCNDMHMPISTPSLWYYNHLYHSSQETGERPYNVTGVSLPGMPYVLVGHNEDIAWGATVSFLDNEDLFIEKLNQSNPEKFLFKNEWQPVESFQERIKIRGKQDHIEHVRKTRHGPLISDFLVANEQAIALKSVALQPEEGFDGFSQLGESRNWDDFIRAVNAIKVPPLNIIYADSSGNIGYYLSGIAPIRATGKGQVPVPGWTGEYEWIGTVPFEEMPHALNPKQGYLVTANNKIVGQDYPYYLGISWRNGFRARRITELLEANNQVTVEDCQVIQNDILSVPGRELAALLSKLDINDPDAIISLALLKQWDGKLAKESSGGAVYKIFMDLLARKLLLPKLGMKLFGEIMGEGHDPILYPASELHGLWPVIALRLLEQPDSPWWKSGLNRLTIVSNCLADTTRFLRKNLGDEPEGWHWGLLHEIQFNHIMVVQPVLGPIFSHGPYQVGGDQDTVAQTSVVSGEPGNNIAAAYRQIVNLGELNQSLAMHVPGQSGNLASCHYGDLVDSWMNGSYYPMSWDVDEMKEKVINLLELTPMTSL